MSKHKQTPKGLWITGCVFLLGTLSSNGCATTAGHPRLSACQQQLRGCQQQRAEQNHQLAQHRKVMADERSARKRAERQLRAYKEIAQRLRAAFGAGGLRIVVRNGRLVVQLPNRILFNFGEAKVTAEGQGALAKLAPVLKTVTGRSLLIAGHTDSVPVRDKNRAYKNNWELSTLRSLAVLRVLYDDGVSGRQLGAAGFGEYDPERDNDTDEGRAANRRTEIIIMPRIDEIPDLPGSI